MKTLTHVHTAALALLARPTIGGSLLALLHGLADHADLLWFRDADTTLEPDVLVFCDAVDRLCEVADVGAPRVNALLNALGYSWRHVPVCSLREMACALAEIADRKRAILEARHVAWWFEQARFTKKQAASTFSEMLAAALAWKANDEIHLRQQAFGWDFPISQEIVKASGFELMPIISTHQLVNTEHHKGVLCSVSLAQACSRGEQAWIYARSVFGGPTLELCLFGLTRDCTNSPWKTKEAYAPPEYLESLHKVALSVGARANARDTLAAIRRNTTGFWSTAESLASWATSIKS